MQTQFCPKSTGSHAPSLPNPRIRGQTCSVGAKMTELCSTLTWISAGAKAITTFEKLRCSLEFVLTANLSKRSPLQKLYSGSAPDLIDDVHLWKVLARRFCRTEFLPDPRHLGFEAQTDCVMLCEAMADEAQSSRFPTPKFLPCEIVEALKLTLGGPITLQG